MDVCQRSISLLRFLYSVSRRLGWFYNATSPAGLQAGSFLVYSNPSGAKLDSQKAGSAPGRSSAQSMNLLRFNSRNNRSSTSKQGDGGPWEGIMSRVIWEKVRWAKDENGLNGSLSTDLSCHNPSQWVKWTWRIWTVMLRRSFERMSWHHMNNKCL